jgi:hypothetical protein
VILPAEIAAVRFAVLPRHLAVTVEIADDIRNTVRIEVVLPRDICRRFAVSGYLDA